uniref:Uncharacterized protein n=1 Tax=Amphimedon queenslandica TaxID=400682 RepID=A0A1X7SNS5_AMPQE
MIMAHGGMNPTSVLEAIAKLGKFQLETPSNLSVLSNISTLIPLKEKFEVILSKIESQINLLLVRSKLAKFHQNLHKFCAYDMPSLLELESSKLLLPEPVLKDFILWQCIVDHIISAKLLEPQSHADTLKVRILSQVEQNGLRYAAGAVIRKLLEENRFDIKKFQILDGLLISENNEADGDSSTVWLSNTNRGGLKIITDLAFELFIEIEQFVY